MRSSRSGLLDDDQIFHGFNPACLRVLFNVPGATSSPGLPATVTRPGFVACLNCRCDPRCRTTDQPSSSSCFTMSRTFTSTSLSHDACGTRLPRIATYHDASPLGWSQIWSHLLANAANRLEISTSEALLGLPWAQGVAGSNPVAPTTFRVPGFQRGSTYGAMSCVSQAASQFHREGTPLPTKRKSSRVCWGLKRTRRLPVAEKTKSTSWT